MRLLPPLPPLLQLLPLLRLCLLDQLWVAVLLQLPLLLPPHPPQGRSLTAPTCSPVLLLVAGVQQTRCELLYGACLAPHAETHPRLAAAVAPAASLTAAGPAAPVAAWWQSVCQVASVH